MEQKFKIIIGSPLDYENLVAYIWINNEEIALVQKEEGNDNLIIEFFEEKINTKIYFDIFIEALLCAKSELLKE